MLPTLRQAVLLAFVRVSGDVGDVCPPRCSRRCPGGAEAAAEQLAGTGAAASVSGIGLAAVKVCDPLASADAKDCADLWHAPTQWPVLTVCPPASAQGHELMQRPAPMPWPALMPLPAPCADLLACRRVLCTKTACPPAATRASSGRLCRFARPLLRPVGPSTQSPPCVVGGPVSCPPPGWRLPVRGRPSSSATPRPDLTSSTTSVHGRSRCGLCRMAPLHLLALR